MPLRVLLVGKSGRVDCMAAALVHGPEPVELYTFSEVRNPGLLDKAARAEFGRTENCAEVEAFARKIKPDLVIIGPEEPLAAGVVDVLQGNLGIPCVGPTRSLARLETSKSFTRRLLDKYGIPGNPHYRVFADEDGLGQYLRTLGEFVVKPDGLTGGKGVKVSGEHLDSVNDAVDYCRSIFSSGSPVVVEEKLDGEEFSLQSFCDGRTVVHTSAVQDHKRAFDGDVGPNTGGMGSYSGANLSLPFLSDEHLEAAKSITERVAEAIAEELQEEYKGILYGGFMLTRAGIKLVEYNARFGDPEVMNVLPLLECDFAKLCEAIVSGTLNEFPFSMRRKATVCKYVVPEGYPASPEKNVRIFMDGVRKDDNMHVYYAAVDQRDDGLYLTGSRAVAFVGIGDTIEEAQRVAENGALAVRGPVRHRADIGTSALVKKRIDHVTRLTTPGTANLQLAGQA